MEGQKQKITSVINRKKYQNSFFELELTGLAEGKFNGTLTTQKLIHLSNDNERLFNKLDIWYNLMEKYLIHQAIQLVM